MPEEAVELLYEAMPGKLPWSVVDPERKEVWHTALRAAAPVIRNQLLDELARDPEMGPALDSIRQQAAQQERERLRQALDEQLSPDAPRNVLDRITRAFDGD